MSVKHGILAIVAVLATAGGAAAQSRSCSLPEGKLFTRTQTVQGDMYEITGPLTFNCTGGVTIRGDRAVVFDWTKEIQVNGNAVYSDPEKTISGSFLNHRGLAGALNGSGNVVLTDKKTGTVIRGETLDHTFAKDGNLAHTRVYGGRPHATIRRAPSATPGDTANAPVEVDADWFEITGETDFRALATTEAKPVTFERGDVSGTALEVRFNQTGEKLLFLRVAHLKNPDFRLDGDSIDATLAKGELSEVLAHRRAKLHAEQIQIVGNLVRMFFEESKLQRLVARGEEYDPEKPLPNGVDPRAVATAEDFRLVADSIEALAPGQQLEQVTAVGHAFGERLDSVYADLPAIASRDWLRGDTIYGYFVADPAAPAAASRDGEARQRVIDKLIAVAEGEGAQSMHRIREEGQTGSPAINFLIAKRITVGFRGGEVQQVDAEGELKGIHLQPQPKRTAADEADKKPGSDGNGR